MKRLFYFVRHGQTRFNQEKRLQGRCDSPLTYDGIRQVKKLRDILDQQYFDAVYASPAGRVRQTVEILNENQHYPIHYLENLQEPSFGLGEGQEIENNEQIAKCFQYFDWSSLAGDSYQKASERINNCLHEIITKTHENDRILIVSHGTIMQLIQKNLLHINLEEYRHQCQVKGIDFLPNAGTMIFSYEDGEYKLLQEPTDWSSLQVNKEDKIVHFYYVRHGQTLFNVQKKVMGRSDSPLTDLGIKQATLVHDRLQHIPFTKAYCSYAKRAVDTAKIIIAQRDIPLSIEKQLQQLDFGDLEGRYRDDNIEAQLQYCHQHGEDFTVYNGEKKEDLLHRFQSFLQRAVWQAKNGDNILLVSHGTYYTILVDYYAGIKRCDLKQKQISKGKKESYHGGIALFDWYKDHFKLVQLMQDANEWKENL